MVYNKSNRLDKCKPVYVHVHMMKYECAGTQAEEEGKRMKYSVYDIIYRNDSNIKRLLENDLLFNETGFVAFRDGNGEFWYFYKKEGLLVPGQQ